MRVFGPKYYCANCGRRIKKHPKFKDPLRPVWYHTTPGPPFCHNPRPDYERQQKQ